MQKTFSKQVKIIIPARYNSTRFVGKPLIDINGKPMIIRVVEIACETLGKENVFVASQVLAKHDEKYIPRELQKTLNSD